MPFFRSQGAASSTHMLIRRRLVRGWRGGAYVRCRRFLPVLVVVVVMVRAVVVPVHVVMVIVVGVSIRCLKK